MLGKPLNRNELLKELRVVEPAPETDVGYEFLRRVEDLDIKIEVRDVDGRWEIFAIGMPPDLKAECKRSRDPLIRAIWLKSALTHLSKHGVEYLPLDVEEDLNLSLEQDDLDTFRQTLRGWVVELRSVA